MIAKHLGRIAAILLATMIITSNVFAASMSTWPSAGHDLNNTRYQSSETKLNISNVGEMAVKWQLTTNGDVSATPSLDGTNIYFPDKGGMLWALSQKTGSVVWSHQISDYTGVPGDFARDTPAIVGNELILGDQAAYSPNIFAPASVFAVNKLTGALMWKTIVETNAFPIVTQSAVVDQSTSNPVVYIGVASAEELYAGLIPNYTCCSARGSMLALDAVTGQILWKTYMVPQGYSGGDVWGSTPVIDYKRGSVYVGTGNNFSIPPDVLTCVENATTTAQAAACLSPDDHFDSVVALDMHTGTIKWASVGIAYDSFNVSCFAGAVLGGYQIINSQNCPDPGPDYDFGQGPILYTVNSTDLLGDGQKSGQYWAFNPDTGAVVWETQVGPGSSLGGMEWGSAMDGTRIYAADTNFYGIPWTLVNNGVANGATVTSGFWSALDPATGKILWQTADPTGGFDPGAVSAANGVVYACSLDSVGHMYALNGQTGAVLWSFASGGSCNAGAAIVNGVVYWGSGYGGLGTSNHKFYAFTLP